MSYKRNPEKVRSNLIEKGDQVFAKTSIKIHLPKRFLERDLAIMEETITIFGIFPIILDKESLYGLMNVNAMVKLGVPFNTKEIEIDSVKYLELNYEPGNLLLDSKKVVKKDTLMFNILDEFLLKGKIPWYVSYDDLGKFLDTSESHAGSSLNRNLEVIETLVAMIARDSKNRKKYTRNVTKEKDPPRDKVFYVPLGSVLLSIKGTTNKLIGSYFEEGVVSSLVEDSKDTTALETLLRN